MDFLTLVFTGEILKSKDLVLTVYVFWCKLGCSLAVVEGFLDKRKGFVAHLGDNPSFPPGVSAIK